MRKTLLITSLIMATNALAATPQEFLKQYEAQAKTENAAFSGFSVERGAQFFHAERARSDGQKMSCAACHTADPRNQGKTRANKVIEPMATLMNPLRFTDQAKIEKWFGRNCKDVLERICTAQEKGDFIQYLVNVK